MFLCLSAPWIYISEWSWLPFLFLPLYKNFRAINLFEGALFPRIFGWALITEPALPFLRKSNNSNFSRNSLQFVLRKFLSSSMLLNISLHDWGVLEIFELVSLWGFFWEMGWFIFWGIFCSFWLLWEFISFVYFWCTWSLAGFSFGIFSCLFMTIDISQI